MSLSPFGRRGGFYDAHSEVNRLLDEMFGGIGRRPGSRGAQATVQSGHPQWTSFKRRGTW